MRWQLHDESGVVVASTRRAKYSAYPPDGHSARRVALGLLALNLAIGLAIFLVNHFVGGAVVLGDSLVIGNHELLHEMKREARYGRLVFDYGDWGYKIADIRALFESDLRPFFRLYLFKAMILFWDSDVSDVDETLLSAAEIAIVRAAYETDVRYVVGEALKGGAYVALSGPALLLKLNKTAMIDAYTAINRRICAEYSIEYIDVRTPLLASYDAGVDPTRDGEHFNNVGTTIVGDLFVHQLYDWWSRP